MTSLRIGMVSFINTAPFYWIWRQTVHEPHWQVVDAAPSHLNRLLHRGELDLAIGSSHEYACHPGDYFLLDGLSIASDGAVGSVFLFSHRPPAELDGAAVSLSPQSQTSNALARIILEEQYQVRPRYLGNGEGPGDAVALVAIGDEALRLARRNAFPVRLDLGAAWQDLTGLPFVFATWMVRRDAWEGKQEEIRRVADTLRRCVAAAKDPAHLEAVSRVAAPLVPMAVEDCLAYLRGLHYDLDHDKKQSLLRFYRYLVDRGEADPACLDIQYCAA